MADLCITVKGIGSILFLENGLKIICRKNYKFQLRSNSYEVCTTVERCFPNILDVIVLENVIGHLSRFMNGI
jgi:hypothetical protein